MNFQGLIDILRNERALMLAKKNLGLLKEGIKPALIKPKNL